MTHIEFIYDSVLLKGLILKRTAFYLEVQLISPFETWENYTMISGMCRGTPNHLLTEHGDKCITRLLIESYERFKILHKRFDSVIKEYISYKEELIAAHDIADIKMRNTIKSKLEDWFFDDLFITSVTGVFPTHGDRAPIFEILENHLIERDLRTYRKTRDPVYAYLRIVK